MSTLSLPCVSNICLKPLNCNLTNRNVYWHTLLRGALRGSAPRLAHQGHLGPYFMGRASGKELDLVNRWHHQGSSHRSSPPHYQSGSVRHRSHNTGKVRTFTDAQILQQSTAESLLILWYYSHVNIRSVRPSFRTKFTIWATLCLSDWWDNSSHCSQ